MKPWERVGMTPQQWADFSKEVLDEANPKGWKGVLFGTPYYAVNLDEKGELKLLALQENAMVNPGRLLKLLGVGGKLPSAARAAANVAGKLPGATAAALIARNVLPTVARIKTPATPIGPGIVYGPRDALGRATGAAATITKSMINTGTRAAGRIRPPGFVDGEQHARGHLIAKLLGGSGDDARNLTTMFTNANTPVMRAFEKKVADAVRGGQTVRYQVTPIYRGSDPIARGITLRAVGNGSKPINLHVTVLNIPK